jgi:hypothetical protein
MGRPFLQQAAVHAAVPSLLPHWRPKKAVAYGQRSRLRVKLGKARGEHNESGLAQKAEIVDRLSRFRVGPRADINRCTNRHRTAETFGQILSWLLETVRLRSAPELAVGARAEN